MREKKKKSEKLDKRQKNYLKKEFGIKAYKDLTPTILKRLKEELKNLTDTRQQSKVTFKMWDIMTCLIVAVLCGCKDWDEIHDFVVIKVDFFKQFLKLTGGIPSAKTYERVMSIIDYKELERILVDFFGAITFHKLSGMDIMNFDGRVSRGSKRNETIKRDAVSPLNMLSAYSNKYGICIGTQMISDKTNEIPNIPILIERLNIKNTIVTWDALNTQVGNVKAVVENGGDYVVPIKANHHLFYEELQDFFDEKEQEYIIAGKLGTAYKEIHEYKNGCNITYQVFQTREIEWYQEKDKWKNLNSFGMIKKTIEKKDETVIEYRFYISSLDIDINQFYEATRLHWSVENKLHWHLDFTFKQDKNNTLNKNALANLEIVNKFCLAMLSKVQYYHNISLKRIIKRLSLNLEENLVEFIALLILANHENTQSS